MKIKTTFLAAALVLAGCASQGRTDAAVYPSGSFGSSDVDEAALYEADTLVGLGAARPDTPQKWALGLADVEYVSGAYNSHARWIGLDGSAQEQLLIARGEIRDAVGISRQAPSQAVFDALLTAGRAPDAALLQVALANPVFTMGPQATLDRLQHMPRFGTVPYALARTNKAKLGINGSCADFFC